MSLGPLKQKWPGNSYWCVAYTDRYKWSFESLSL